LIELIHQPAQVYGEVLLGSGQLADAHNIGMIDREPAETVLIGTQRIAEHEGVPAVVLGARDGMAVTETIQLFRIDAEDRPLMFQERFDEGTAGYFKGYRDAAHLSFRQLLHPPDKVNDSCTAVLDFPLPQHPPLRIHDAGLVLRGGPIDAQIEMELSCHDNLLKRCRSLDRRSQRQPCTGARRRELPTGLSATGHPTRRCSTLGA
jgi:hypothetical protein